jgi:hypothetical protein
VAFVLKDEADALPALIQRYSCVDSDS